MAEGNCFLVAQLSLVAALLLSLAVIPPAHGAMLLLPITGELKADMVTSVIARGAVPLGRSGRGLIVRGDRSRLAGLIATHRLLLLAAPERLCRGGRA
ncbi:hypothetical protein [Sphingobium sp. CAP-1]|uniref:hypothetical protein n=1 Tax=Sphingobium sp. CAP-1 TaxID=2676077 RepID=UPI0012BB3114|nr:hypothetical protein [Sphingobium sp. CAP-1]QGP80706.1 hypothetical protein GL174_16540 [Sphingobium sp. CAP-1]